MTCRHPASHQGAHLGPPELIPLVGHSPVSVTHHSDQQVEHEQRGNDGEGSVGDAVHDGQVDIIVGRAINDGEKQLKGAEECHEVTVEMAQLIGVLCLEDDVERCSTQGGESYHSKHRVTNPPILHSVGSYLSLHFYEAHPPEEPPASNTLGFPSPGVAISLPFLSPTHLLYSLEDPDTCFPQPHQEQVIYLKQIQR